MQILKPVNLPEISQGWQSGTLPSVRTVSFSVKLDF